MTIKADFSRVSACSSRLSAIELRRASNRIFHQRRSDQWSLYGIDGRNMVGEEVNEIDHVFLYFPTQLTSLRHFRLCHTNEQIWQVSTNLQSRYQDSYAKIIPRWFRGFEQAPIRGMGATFFVSESGEACENIYGEFSVSINIRHVGDRWSRSIQVSQFSRMDDRQRRVHFFEVAIDRLRLNEVLQLVGDRDSFRLEAVEPFKLGLSGADLKGRNPSLFWIELPESFDDAWLRVERLLSDPMIKRIDNMSAGMTMAPDRYEVLHHKLNEIATGWQVDLYGSYADGIDPYTADAAESPDGRFPIFTWMPERECQGIFYQVDIVAASAGRYLEIHSNCGSMQTLLDEAEAATGVRFTPVDPSTASATGAR